jgi:hypothetical protein
MFTICPFLIPFETEDETPTTFTFFSNEFSSSWTWAMTVDTLLLPSSIPAITLLLFIFIIF